MTADGGHLHLAVNMCWTYAYQALLVGDSNPCLDTEFKWLAGFALANTLNFWSVECVQFVFVLALLGMNAGGSLEPHLQGLQLFALVFHQRQLPLYLSEQNPKDRLLAFDGASKSFELLGMRIAPSAPTKLFAFFLKGLLELNASPFGSLHLAISNKRISVGWAMAFSWTVVSTMRRSNSLFLMHQCPTQP